MHSSVKLLLAGLGFGLVTASSSALAEEAQHRYEVKAFPGQLADCQEKASEIAAFFSENFQAEILTATCTGQREGVSRLIVDYYRDSRIPVVSTSRPEGSGIEHHGFYQSSDSCAEEVAAQRELFAMETGLAPFFAHCERLEGFSDEFWFVRLDGFGEAVKRPMLATDVFFGQVLDESYDTFTSGVSAGLARQGYSVYGIKVRSSFGMAYLTAGIYASGRQRLRIAEPLRVATNDECAEQLAEVQGYLSELVFSYCTYTSINGYFEVNTVSLDSATFTTYDVPGRYDDYEACRADLPNVAEQYAERLAVLGVSCTRRELESHYLPVIFHSR